MEYKALLNRLVDIREQMLTTSSVMSKPKVLTDIGQLIYEVREIVQQFDDKCPNWKDMSKPILCVDFDGVLSEYKRGWEGIHIINDKPVEGAIQWLRESFDYFSPVIFSSRCNQLAGITAMRIWLLMNGLESHYIERLRFEPGKPSWYIHVDDRAVQFNGKFSEISPKTLAEQFKPWYYSEPGWGRAQQESKA